jgi:hypothetical protein
MEERRELQLWLGDAVRLRVLVVATLQVGASDKRTETKTVGRNNNDFWFSGVAAHTAYSGSQSDVASFKPGMDL